jgi:hypothetical protein
MLHLKIPFLTLVKIIKQIKLGAPQQESSQHSVKRLQGKDHDAKLDNKLHDELCKRAFPWLAMQGQLVYEPNKQIRIGI